jgi:hypothetical protein
MIHILLDQKTLNHEGHEGTPIKTIDSAKSDKKLMVILTLD